MNLMDVFEKDDGFGISWRKVESIEDIEDDADSNSRPRKGERVGDVGIWGEKSGVLRCEDATKILS